MAVVLIVLNGPLFTGKVGGAVKITWKFVVADPHALVFVTEQL